jgi:hypothetical protein
MKFSRLRASSRENVSLQIFLLRTCEIKQFSARKLLSFPLHTPNDKNDKNDKG